MIFHSTSFPDAWLIELKPFGDDRGWFARTFCQRTFRERGLQYEFAQANHSQCAQAGTLRGLHYQTPPSAEVKLVRCVRGSVFDAIVDMRKNSPTFLRWHGEVLSAKNQRMLYVPEGFAHGYQAIEDNSEVVYQASREYAPQLEMRLRYDDPRVGIDWPIFKATLSSKDDATNFLEVDFAGIEF